MSGPPTRTGIGTVFVPFDTPTLTDVGRVPSAPPRIVVDPLGAPALTGARYEVRSVLGRGGMGEVRLCRDVRIGREVAVKVAHPTRADDGEARARFLREARIQGQLEHPSIVPVHDIEILDDGGSYFAMKRVRGQTLGEILAALHAHDADAERRFPRRKLLAAFNAVCLAVDFAHSRGVVHRDLKPGNVMLGDFGEVYVLDWGLAKVLGDALADDPLSSPGSATDTGAGHLLGTPGYMAPEQINPALGPLGPTSDVYALGAILFEILTLEPLFKTTDPLEIALLTMRRTPEGPSSRAQDVPADLDATCVQALALDPANRFQSARALHDAVDAHLAGVADLERRRELSGAHATRADDALHAGDRPRALSELGSALALDPDNAGARKRLLRLLTSPPATVPDEVSAQLAHDNNAKIREGARVTVHVAGVLIAFNVVTIAIGVREWLTLGLGIALAALSALVTLWTSRAERPARSLEVVGLVLLTCGYGVMSRGFGPLILLPQLLSGAAVVVQAHPDPAYRKFSIVWCAALLAGIFGADAAGIVGSSYSFIYGGLLVHEHALVLGPPALVFAAVSSVAAIVAPSLFARANRRALEAAETKLRVQAWQLEQLLPPEER